MPTFITTNTHDNIIDLHLQLFMKQIYDDRQALFARRDGCSCDDKQLCDFHAAVFARMISLETHAYELRALLMIGVDPE